MVKVFIDGSAGTTGLRIYERLEARRELSLIRLSEEKRKDTEARREALAEADIAFLCLPDAAAIEAVALADGTAHSRTFPSKNTPKHRFAKYLCLNEFCKNLLCFRLLRLVVCML